MARVCSVAQNLIAAGKHYLLESAQVWRGGAKSMSGNSTEPNTGLVSPSGGNLVFTSGTDVTFPQTWES